jgi:NADH-quinone oxidoreductase subunit G
VPDDEAGGERVTDVKKDTVTITVDGKEIEAKPGALLIQACEESGVYIPRFCWHKRMDPVGACRMCLVDIEGSPPIPGTQQRRPQTSCTTVVREGMVVHTQFGSEEVNDAQKMILELLLINHPLDCPICDRGGECPLQDQTQDYGPSESRYTEQKRRYEKPVPISPLINLDRERCILCYRCTRFCDELSGDVLISTMQRGPEAFIFPFYSAPEGGNGHGDAGMRGPGTRDINETFDSYFSGNTVQICPVGALTSTEYRFMARPWDMQNVPTTCNLCASGCSMRAGVRVQDGNVARFSAATNEDTNEEWLCDKGRYGNGYISSPARLTTPLVRRDGALVPTTWDDAFRELNDKLEHVLAGDEDAGVIIGAHLCDEDFYAAQKFARVALRTNNVDHRTEPGLEADALVAPGVTYEDVLTSDLVVVVGTDLREELPILFLRMRIAASKRGLPIAIVHPREVSLSEFAKLRLQPLPGTEHAVASGDASGCGLKGEEIEALQSAMEDATSPIVLLGSRVCSPEAVAAWSALGARVAWLPRRAGTYGALAAGAHPDLLPGWRRLTDDGDAAAIAGEWHVPVPAKAGLDVRAMLDASAELGALWLIGADVLDVPGGAAALERARYVVVQDVQQSPLLEHADLVLPAAVFVERDGTLTNWEGRRQPINAAVDPPGAARADYAILAEVARRLGRPIGCRTHVQARDELDALLQGRAPSGEARAEQKSSAAREGLVLLTSRLLYDDGARIRDTEGIRELTQGSFAEINVADAERLHITNGAHVRVASPHGAITVRARVTDAIREGVVFVPWSQWGITARDLVTWDDPNPTVVVEAT